MTTAILLALLAAAPAAASPAVELTTEDRAEIVRLYEKVDANGDRKVSRAEMAAFGAAMRLGTAVRTKVWREMDANRDGWISKDEFLANALQFKARRQIASR